MNLCGTLAYMHTKRGHRRHREPNIWVLKPAIPQDVNKLFHRLTASYNHPFDEPAPEYLTPEWWRWYAKSRRRWSMR